MNFVDTTETAVCPACKKPLGELGLCISPNCAVWRTTELTEAPPLERYDYTRLSNFTCMEKYHLGMEECWSEEEIAEGLAFGIDIHNGMEEYYKVLKAQGAHKSEAHKRVFKPAVKAAAHAFTDSYIQHIAFPKRSLDMGLTIFTDYALLYGIESEWTIIETEQPFSVLFDNMPDGVPFLYEGIMDLRLEDSQGRRCIMDHKTRYRIDEVWKNAPPFQQVRGYMWADWKIHGTPPDMGWLNGIATTQRGKTVDRQYYRWPVCMWSEPMMEDWERDVAAKVMHIRECRRTGVWPKNDQVCSSYNRVCEFMPVCMTAPALRENALRRFVKRVWDPLDRD